jgi:DMSO/TMAO reductase YedYZ molybdopterin-dependent catalytic subunit
VTEAGRSPRGDPTRVVAALAGLVGAGVALAVSELVTGLREPGPSLVSAVGTEFIDRFAASLKTFAVELFGTNDKAALVVGIVVMSLGLGALFGVLARRQFRLGVAGFVAFGAVGLWAYTRHPQGSVATGVAASALAVAAGIASLAVLLRAGSPEPAPVSPVQGCDVPATAAASRRSFLLAATVLGVGAAGTAFVGRRVRGADAAAAARRRYAVPRPSVVQAVPAQQPFAVAGISPYVTPSADFYRIDTALTVPQVDPDSWQLDVTGMVDRPFSITFDELLAMDAVEETVTLQCVSNEIGGDLVGNAVWQGIPLHTLLDRAGVHPDATQIVGRSVDRWTAGFPTELAANGRVALVAYAMNGELLPARHGFPARLVVSGLYGYVSATKWLREVELTTWESFDGYWVPRGWAKEGPIKTMSRIDVPRSRAVLPPGPTAVAGVAWAPTRGIERVEVEIDGGGWRSCRLGAVASEHTWVQWLSEWDATPGDHVLRVRATDGTGTTQPEAISRPAPDGATGWHSRRVRVESS